MDLSRIARGGTPITLDKPRLLLFDMAATWLLIQKYGTRYLQALYSVPTAKDDLGLVLNDMEALRFYLWVGLQADCALSQKKLSLEQVGEFITPFTLPAIFNAVITALSRDMNNPPRKGEDQAGKADAAAAGPAAAAVDTGRKPEANRSTSSKKSVSR